VAKNRNADSHTAVSPLRNPGLEVGLCDEISSDWKQESFLSESQSYVFVKELLAEAAGGVGECPALD
jgi:hypothetical protein